VIPGIFVTGTGTDVGKTVVTAGVLRWLRRNFVEPNAAMVMKPVQTGCELDSAGRMRAPDVEFVLRAAEIKADDETVAHAVPYRFAPACSPHLAARMAGERIELDKILASAEWLAGRYGRLVLEGAGGLAVPLNESQTMLDLISELRMPVLLVGHSGLGTINHTLLSLEALRRRGCDVAGVMLNEKQPVAEAERYIHEDNVHAIERFGEVAVRHIPYLRTAAEAPSGAAAHADFDFAVLDAIVDHCRFIKECLL